MAHASRTPMRAELVAGLPVVGAGEGSGQELVDRGARVVAARRFSTQEVLRRGGWPAQRYEGLLQGGATEVEAVSAVAVEAGIVVPGADFLSRTWDPVARGEVVETVGEPVTLTVPPGGQGPSDLMATAVRLAQSQTTNPARGIR